MQYEITITKSSCDAVEAACASNLVICVANWTQNSCLPGFGKHLCKEVKRCESCAINMRARHRGDIWDIRCAGMIANTFFGVQLWDFSFYISLACDLIRSNCHCFQGCSDLIKSLIWMLDHHPQQPQKKPTEWCLMGRCDKCHRLDLDLSHVLIFCLQLPSLLPSLYLAFQIQRHWGRIQIFHYFGVAKFVHISSSLLKRMLEQWLCHMMECHATRWGHFLPSHLGPGAALLHI